MVDFGLGFEVAFVLLWRIDETTHTSGFSMSFVRSLSHFLVRGLTTTTKLVSDEPKISRVRKKEEEVDFARANNTKQENSSVEYR